MTTLTDSYKAKVRRHLGYPPLSTIGSIRFEEWTTSQSVSIVLEQNMNNILDADSQAAIVSVVDSLDALTEKITAAEGRGAKVESIGKGDIKLNQNEMWILWKQHYVKATELANMLAVEILKHPYKRNTAGRRRFV